jgi:enoyl-CoA hydratase
MSATPSTGEAEVLTEQQGGLALVTLNRPKALNSLSLGMYRIMDPQLMAWASDPSVHVVAIKGAGDRAFCAGGDVRAVYEARGTSGEGDYKADFFREEYTLIQRVHRFPKPYVALIDGITMGGGMGVSVNGSHRVATEKAVFAMPEIHIGLFPDVGASRFLNKCPGRVGRYLALTAKRLHVADALYCGFVTHHVPHARLAELQTALAVTSWRKGEERAQLDALLADFATDPGLGSLAPLQGAIDRCFGGNSVEEIVAALEKEPGDWAIEALQAMRRGSPTSLKILFRQLELGVGMEIEAALTMEYRMTQHCMAGQDFYEGIRAVLVDKDQKPRWQPDTLAGVGQAMVDGYFESLGARDLRFA